MLLWFHFSVETTLTCCCVVKESGTLYLSFVEILPLSWLCFKIVLYSSNEKIIEDSVLFGIKSYAFL